jgi:hypothetical protein
MRHLRCTLEQLEREAAEELAYLRMIASSPAVSRELWICSPRGTFRFFRITDNGLVELDRDGRPLPEEVSFTRIRKPADAAGLACGYAGEVPAVPAPPLTHLIPELSRRKTCPLTDTSVGEGILTGHREGENT